MLGEKSIIIVSYNNVKILFQTICSLLKYLEEESYEIIIIDNASTENNVEMIKKEFPQIKLIINDKNVGFGKANNQGAEIANGDYLFFVNGDIVLNGNPFTEMISFCEQNKNTGLLGAQLLNQDGSLQPSYYNLPTITKRIIELLGLKKYFLKFYPTNKKNSKLYFRVSVVKGAFFLIKNNLFKKLGGFDDYYFMYIEDIDLSNKAIEKGYHNYLYNCRDIIHLGWNQESILNEFVFFHRNRGLIYFYKKNYSKFVYRWFVIINFVILGIRFLYYSSMDHHKEKQIVLKKIWLLYAKALSN
jgi:GT2 family glycosyltransferase